MPGLVVGQGRRSTLKTLVCSTRSNASREKVAERLSKMEFDSLFPFNNKPSIGVTVEDG